MGRFFMYATIGLLALFVVSTFTMLQHGSEGLGLVKTLSPHDLAGDPQPYIGATVVVDGTLIFNEENDRYELTDDAATVATPIMGLDEDELAPFLGEFVRVNGVYESSGGARRINADSIRLLEDPSPTPQSTARPAS